MKNVMVEEPREFMESRLDTNNFVPHAKIESALKQSAAKDDDSQTNGASTLRDRKEEIVVKKVPILSIGGQSLKIDFDQKNTRGKSHDF